MDNQPEALPPGVDPTKPSAGRLYDMYLGGDQYLEVDRVAADRIRALIPEIEDAAATNRIFLQRATRWMAKSGIDQFIDIGAGLPTRFNTHQAAQAINPDARIVQVDNDPMIYGHAQELLRGVKGVTYITADFRQPEAILDHPEVRAQIDFRRPVGYLMVAVIHFVADDDDPYGLVRRYLAAVPSGSRLAISHITAEGQAPAKVQRFLDVYANASEQLYFRTRAEVKQMFTGLELIPPYEGAEPDVCHLGEWGASDPREADVSGTWAICGVGRKP
jgi:S-adenosyl methyltransferase